MRLRKGGRHKREMEWDWWRSFVAFVLCLNLPTDSGEANFCQPEQVREVVQGTGQLQHRRGDGPLLWEPQLQAVYSWQVHPLWLQGKKKPSLARFSLFAEKEKSGLSDSHTSYRFGPCTAAMDLACGSSPTVAGTPRFMTRALGKGLTLCSSWLKR